jgi:hypothetical protein
LSRAVQAFQNVTPDNFKAIESRLQQFTGITISTSDGDVTSHGVEVKWDYDGADVLTVQCIKHPWVVSDSYVQGKLTALVQGAGN